VGFRIFRQIFRHKDRFQEEAQSLYGSEQIGSGNCPDLTCFRAFCEKLKGCKTRKSTIQIHHSQAQDEKHSGYRLFSKKEPENQEPRKIQDTILENTGHNPV
jgi:hypothetical protein